MEKITIKNTIYYKVPAIGVSQKGVAYYVGVISVSALYKVFTVEPLIYTESNYKYEDFDFTDFSSDDLLKKIETDKESHFQRERDETKVRSIKKYLADEKYSLFPNSIIAAAKLKNSFMDDDFVKDPSSVRDKEWLENFNKLPGIYYYENYLYIPERDNAILVIDGQHRLLGFEDFDDVQKDEFDLIVSFLVGMDNSVLAQLFYTINFNQKPVNKSLLFHLTSEFEEDLSEIKLLHEFIRILNENKKSPFFSKIKMLGKGQGFVSQAYLIEMLLPYFLKTKRKSKTIPIFRYYFVNEQRQIMILNMLLKYFIAVQNIVNRNNNLWDAGGSVFTKTIGLGALIKIFPKVMLALMKRRNIENAPDQIDNIKTAYFEDILDPISSIELNQYIGGGSLGLVSRLRNELEKKLQIENINNDYVAKNIEWLNEFYY